MTKLAGLVLFSSLTALLGGCGTGQNLANDSERYNATACRDALGLWQPIN